MCPVLKAECHNLWVTIGVDNGTVDLFQVRSLPILD